MVNNSTLTGLHPEFTIEEVSILAIILILIICISLYGNCGLIYVLYQNDKMWTSYYVLIGNLATSGILISFFSMPFSLATIIIGFWPFTEEAVCTAVAFMNSLLLLATIFTHTMISVGKYFAVVKPFSRAMTITRTKRIIFFIWFIAVLVSAGPLFKFGRYSYGPTTLACGIGFPENKIEMLYLLALASIGFVLPNGIMAFVYINVFIAVRKHSNRLGKSSSTTTQSVVSLHKKLVLTALTSLVCFLLCWSPFCIFMLMSLFVGSRTDLPHALGITAYWCGFSYNALNPLIIASMCSRFGEGLRSTTMTLLDKPIKLYHYLRETLCGCCFNKIIELGDSKITTPSQIYAKYTVKGSQVKHMQASISSRDLLDNITK